MRGICEPIIHVVNRLYHQWICEHDIRSYWRGRPQERARIFARAHKIKEQIFFFEKHIKEQISRRFCVLNPFVGRLLRCVRSVPRATVGCVWDGSKWSTSLCSTLFLRQTIWFRHWRSWLARLACDISNFISNHINCTGVVNSREFRWVRLVSVGPMIELGRVIS